MKLTGLHFLLSYKCTYECEHCFVFGSPTHDDAMTLTEIRGYLQQARELGTVRGVYFEGGEPFLYYPVLLRAVREAHAFGFDVGIVSNAFWASTEEDAREWLAPLAGLVKQLSVSSDVYHASEKLSARACNARASASELGIPCGLITIAEPETKDAGQGSGQIPTGESAVMYRGRAVDTLAGDVSLRPWDEFDTCPHEDLREPGRLHLDCFGNLSTCQGITLGRLPAESLAEVCGGYDPEADPVLGPLIAGGPAELVRRHGLEHADGYADACHLCFEARRALRAHHPRTLAPALVYGASDETS